MLWEKSSYEEPIEGGCAKCGAESPECELCGSTDLIGEDFLCDGNEKHICKKCADEIIKCFKKVKK